MSEKSFGEWVETTKGDYPVWRIETKLSHGCVMRVPVDGRWEWWAQLKGKSADGFKRQPCADAESGKAACAAYIKQLEVSA